jgi:FKBP-type peptidyl-prolyl cis-trans isomerase
MRKFAIIIIAVCIVGGIMFDLYQSYRVGEQKKKYWSVEEASPPNAVEINALSIVNDQLFIKTSSGLQYQDLRVGTGPQPEKGQTVTLTSSSS